MECSEPLRLNFSFPLNSWKPCFLYLSASVWEFKDKSQLWSVCLTFVIWLWKTQMCADVRASSLGWSPSSPLPLTCTCDAGWWTRLILNHMRQEACWEEQGQLEFRSGAWWQWYREENGMWWRHLLLSSSVAWVSGSLSFLETRAAEPSRDSVLVTSQTQAPCDSQRVSLLSRVLNHPGSCHLHAHGLCNALCFCPASS